MDKQVRLIDAEKPLDKARVGGNTTTYSEFVEWIESGILAPDPIPPTIKPGDKVKTRFGTGVVTRADEDFHRAVVKLDAFGTHYTFNKVDLEVSHD